MVDAQGRHAEAEGLFRQSLEIDIATIGEAHPDYAIHLANLANLLGKTGRPAEARQMLDEAMSTFRATLPVDHPYIAETQRRIDALPDPGK